MAPELPELRAVLSSALAQYPELRRGLRQALADVDRALGREPTHERRDRRRLT